MQSPMITLNPNLIPTDLFMDNAVRGGYSDLRVLRSNAGHYVGTVYEEYDAEGKLVWQEPGSRDTGYYDTEEEAALTLRQMQGGDLTDVRYTPDSR